MFFVFSSFFDFSHFFMSVFFSQTGSRASRSDFSIFFALVLLSNPVLFFLLFFIFLFLLNFFLHVFSLLIFDIFDILVYLIFAFFLKKKITSLIFSFTRSTENRAH